MSATTRVPAPRPPDAREVVDRALLELPARRTVTRAEAIGVLTSVGDALAGEPGAEEIFRPLFAALDAIGTDPLVDRSVVADALLDARLVLASPRPPDAPDVGEELRDAFAVAHDRPGADA